MKTFISSTINTHQQQCESIIINKEATKLFNMAAIYLPAQLTAYIF